MKQLFIRNIMPFIIMVLLVGVPQVARAEKASAATRVLVVGNSLTYTNDFPQVLSAIAANYGLEVEATCFCKPNYALIDHWKEGDLQTEIAKGKYDWVLLQQGPSSQSLGRQILLEYGSKIKVIAEKEGGQVGFLTVWPAVQYFSTFNGVVANYKEAAQKQGALLLPAGTAWQTYIQQYDDYSLYGPDLFHPSMKGTFLAALSAFHQLFPQQDIEALHYRQVATWLPNKSTLNRMVKIVVQQSAESYEKG